MTLGIMEHLAEDRRQQNKMIRDVSSDATANTDDSDADK